MAKGKEVNCVKRAAAKTVPSAKFQAAEFYYSGYKVNFDQGEQTPKNIWNLLKPTKKPGKLHIHEIKMIHSYPSYYQACVHPTMESKISCYQL